MRLLWFTPILTERGKSYWNWGLVKVHSDYAWPHWEIRLGFVRIQF